MDHSAELAPQALEPYFLAMLSGVLHGASWTREPDANARMDKLADCANAFAQAACLAYPDSEDISWRVAGEIAVREAAEDSVITASFGDGKPCLLDGVLQLVTEAKKRLVSRMAVGCSSSRQRQELIKGATTPRHLKSASDGPDAWIQLATAASDRLEGIQKRLCPEAIATRVHKSKLAFASAQQAFSEQMAGRDSGQDAFFGQQALLAMSAKAAAKGGEEQRLEALGEALSIAQLSALSKDLCAQEPFEAALSALEELMPRERGSNANQKLINKSAMFWIGALHDPQLEPMASRCLRVLLRQSAPLFKENPLMREERLKAFEELRLGWARAALGEDPGPADFKRFSSGSGWVVEPHRQERLMAFSGLEHAACSALSSILSPLKGGSFDASELLRSIAGINRAQEFGLAKPESRRFEPELLIKGCNEGLSRLRERLWAIGQGERWSAFNEQLKTVCGPEWSSAEQINLAQAAKSGLPVDRVAAALTSGALGHNPAMLAELSGALTESRDRLIATLEAQELCDTLGAPLASPSRLKMSL